MSKNIGDYGVYELDEFRKDLNKVIKKEVAKNPSKYSGTHGKTKYLINNPTMISSDRFGSPLVENPNFQEGFEIFNIKQQKVKTQATSNLKSMFYNGIVQNNSKLKADVQEYINYIGSPKKAGANVGSINAAEYKKIAKPEVLYVLEDLKGTAQKNFLDLNKFKNVDDYRFRVNRQTQTYLENLATIEKKLKIPKGQLINQMHRTSEKLKELFGIKGARGMTTEHILGIAEAAQSNDPEKMRKVINTTRILASEENRIKGWEYDKFDQTKRRKLKQFKETTDLIEKQTIRDELNAFQDESKIKFTIDKKGDLKQTPIGAKKSPYARVKDYFIGEAEKGKLLKKKEFSKLPKETQEILTEIKN